METDPSATEATAAGDAVWKRRLWYLVLGTLSVVVLFPIYMALVRALSAPAPYLVDGQPPYPVDPQWTIWFEPFRLDDLGAMILISVVATVIIVAGQLVTSVLAAYAFAFLDFPFKRTVFVVFMATLMLPIEVTLIPNVKTMRTLGFINSYPGLTLPFLATAFGTFLIRQGFRGIPPDIIDASRLDGYGHLAFLRRVAIPLTRPIIASFVVLTFLGAWNQYTWPRGDHDR